MAHCTLPIGTTRKPLARSFSEIGPPSGYRCEWIEPTCVLQKTRAVKAEGLRGALWGPDEITVDPGVVLARLPEYLAEQRGVQFRFGCAMRAVELPLIEAGTERWQTDYAIICAGDDFETLFPSLFRASGITRCKLQMMRTVAA